MFWTRNNNVIITKPSLEKERTEIRLSGYSDVLIHK